MNTKISTHNLSLRRLLLLLFLIHTNLFCLCAQSPDLDSIKSWMNYLASDNMKGRRNGSPENDKIAGWIAREYSSYGIIPLPGQGSLVQSFKQRTSKDSIILKNVVGCIPGAEGNRYIVLSAHYDHIGLSRNNPQDSVFNGADDDASGIVTMLGIAKKFSEQGLKPSCTIVFAAFSGEEIGLKGSAYFCRSKIIPVEQIKLNLNFELTGRSDEYGKNRYYITGPKRSNLEQFLVNYNLDKQWQLANIGSKADMLYYMADNFSFGRLVNYTKLHIPAHTLATSVGEGYIHQVDDEAGFIDYENLNSFIEYISGLLLKLSDSETEISTSENTNLSN